MAKIKYIGKGPRMVWGQFMHNGDVRDVNPKIAKEIMSDANFVITWEEGEQPVPVKPMEVVKPAPVYKENRIELVIENEITDEEIEEFVKPPRKQRGKKK